MYDIEKECKRVIEELNRLCKIHGYNCYALSKETGLAYSTVYSILHGKTMPRISTLLDLCNVFQVPLQTMLEHPSKTDDICLEEEQCLIKKYRNLPEGKRRLLLLIFNMLEQYTATPGDIEKTIKGIEKQ